MPHLLSLHVDLFWQWEYCFGEKAKYEEKHREQWDRKMAEERDYWNFLCAGDEMLFVDSKLAEAGINIYSRFQLFEPDKEMLFIDSKSPHATSALRLTPKLFYNHLVVLKGLLYSIGHYAPKFRAFLCLPIYTCTNYTLVPGSNSLW